MLSVHAGFRSKARRTVNPQVPGSSPGRGARIQAAPREIAGPLSLVYSPDIPHLGNIPAVPPPRVRGKLPILLAISAYRHTMVARFSRPNPVIETLHRRVGRLHQVSLPLLPMVEAEVKEIRRFEYVTFPSRAVLHHARSTEKAGVHKRRPAGTAQAAPIRRLGRDGPERPGSEP